MTQKNKRIIYLSVFLLALILISIAILYLSPGKAAAAIKLSEWEVDYPFGGPSSDAIPDYVEFIYRAAFFIGAALAVIMIIIGGIQWSASGLSPQQKNEAKDKITKSIMGVLLLLGSYVLLNTINPDLVTLKQPVAADAPQAESGPDTVKTVKAEVQCEANADGEAFATYNSNVQANLPPTGHVPLCGELCSYYCTGKYNGHMLWPKDPYGFIPQFFEQKRTFLGLEDDLGYMVGHDPGSGVDDVWCGCYALPEPWQDKKNDYIRQKMEEKDVYEEDKLPQDVKDDIAEKYEFQFLETIHIEEGCEFFDNNCLERCGTTCFDVCRGKYPGKGYPDLAADGRVLGVIASSNAGGDTDETYCSCLKIPSEDVKLVKKIKDANGEEKEVEEKFDFRLNEVVTYGYNSGECDTNGENCCSKESYCKKNECRAMPPGQPCEGAGDGYPRCGNYCYDFCKKKDFKFGLASSGNWGAGTDEVYCTCMK